MLYNVRWQHAGSCKSAAAAITLSTQAQEVKHHEVLLRQPKRAATCHVLMDAGACTPSPVAPKTATMLHRYHHLVQCPRPVPPATCRFMPVHACTPPCAGFPKCKMLCKVQHSILHRDHLSAKCPKWPSCHAPADPGRCTPPPVASKVCATQHIAHISSPCTVTNAPGTRVLCQCTAFSCQGRFVTGITTAANTHSGKEY